MEVMDASLDKFYKKVYTDTVIPEDVLSIIASSVSKFFSNVIALFC